MRHRLSLCPWGGPGMVPSCFRRACRTVPPSTVLSVALCPPIPDGHGFSSAPEPTLRGHRGAGGKDRAADGQGLGLASPLGPRCHGRGGSRHRSRAPGGPGAARVSPQGKPDLNTALPVRQTASIFKQPVTKITNHPSNKVKSDPQKAVEQPRQVSVRAPLRALSRPSLPAL